MNLRNIREFKTSFIGICLLGVGVYYMLELAERPYTSQDFWVMATLLVVAIFMLLAPNRILGIFDRIFSSKFPPRK